MRVKIGSGEIAAVTISLAIHAAIFSLSAGSGLPRETAVHPPELKVSLIPDIRKSSSSAASKNRSEVKPDHRKSGVGQPHHTKSGDSYAITSNEHFFTLPELEKAPQILQDIDPNPAGLEAYQEGGSVVIRLWINEEGEVVDQALVESILPAPFVDNAMESFRNAKFLAGLKDGRAVKSVVTVVVNYAPMSS